MGRKNRRAARRTDRPYSTVNDANFSTDGMRIVTAGSDDTARLWDGRTGRPLAIMKVYNVIVYVAEFLRMVRASLRPIVIRLPVYGSAVITP